MRFSPLGVMANDRDGIRPNGTTRTILFPGRACLQTIAPSERAASIRRAVHRTSDKNASILNPRPSLALGDVNRFAPPAHWSCDRLLCDGGELMASPALSSPLSSTWNRYRAWSLTARELKTSLDRWTLWTLILAVAGAVLVTLGQQLGSTATIIGPWAGPVGKIVGLGGAAAIALSTYFAREALSNE